MGKVGSHSKSYVIIPSSGINDFQFHRYQQLFGISELLCSQHINLNMGEPATVEAHQRVKPVCAVCRGGERFRKSHTGFQFQSDIESILH